MESPGFRFDCTQCGTRYRIIEDPSSLDTEKGREPACLERLTSETQYLIPEKPENVPTQVAISTSSRKKTYEEIVAELEPSFEALRGRHESSYTGSSKVVEPHQDSWPKDISQQTHSRFFTTLVPELRQNIYNHLLVSETPIHSPNQLIGRERDRKRKIPSYSSALPTNGLDATILRVCKLIYAEAFSTLYKQNTFLFILSEDMNDFQHDGLNTALREACRSTQQRLGRLSEVRNLELNITGGVFELGTPPGNRNLITMAWYRFILQEQSWGQPVVDFPELRVLTLDFGRWMLGPEEGKEEIESFVIRFRDFRKDGLDKLVVKGVKHQATLDYMRETLLKDGGVFLAED